MTSLPGASLPPALWVAWAAAGVALGAGFLWLARRRGPERARWVVGVGLVVAAAIYLAFAALARDWTAAVIAGAGLALFAGVAHAGVWWAPVWLAVGWVAHAVWDVALHVATPAAPATAPAWYAALCVGFDMVVAAGVYATAARKESRNR